MILRFKCQHGKVKKKNVQNAPFLFELWLYLQEVLDPLRVVAVALSADPLHFFDLASLTGSLNVFEVDLWILAEIHNGAQEIEQT